MIRVTTVDVTTPPRMTTAIGCAISRPAMLPSDTNGSADYRRHLAGRLRYAFLVRLPLEKDLVSGEHNGAFVYDTWLRDHLHALVDRALLPDLVAACLDDSRDEPIEPGQLDRILGKVRRSAMRRWRWLHHHYVIRCRPPGDRQD